MSPDDVSIHSAWVLKTLAALALQLRRRTIARESARNFVPCPIHAEAQGLCRGLAAIGVLPLLELRPALLNLKKFVYFG